MEFKCIVSSLFGRISFFNLFSGVLNLIWTPGNVKVDTGDKRYKIKEIPS
jgi:hypothetical protein